MVLYQAQEGYFLEKYHLNREYLLPEQMLNVVGLASAGGGG
ncbi:hypothetical protein P4646_23360 [Peribacillus simplex]|nr:hypothetical protein [Peribacillus simplex]MED4094239.1 hypothetical protein [Peribacillus simplex]